MKKITFYLQAVLVLSIAGLVAGCASSSYGRKIDGNKVSLIKKGVTTKAEVEQLLGPPAHVGMIGDGRRSMSYSFHETNAHANAASYIPVVGMFAGKAEGKTRSQNLQIMISKSGVVEDYEFSDTTQDIESGMYGHKSSAPVATQEENK